MYVHTQYNREKTTRANSESVANAVAPTMMIRPNKIIKRSIKVEKEINERGNLTAKTARKLASFPDPLSRAGRP